MYPILDCVGIYTIWNQVHEAVSEFKEAGLKLGVTSWSWTWCNQSVHEFRLILPVNSQLQKIVPHFDWDLRNGLPW